MNYRILATTFLLLFIPGMIWTAVQRGQVNTRHTANTVVQSMIGAQESLSESSTPLRHYTVIDSRGSTGGYIFFTDDLAPEVQSYGGNISMAVKVDPDGRIAAIQILRNNETTTYTGDLNIFTQKFIGKRPSDPLELKKDIDAISGATISSEAITRTLKKSLTVFHEKVLASQTATTSLPRPFPWGKVIFSLLVFGLCLAAILTANARLRWIALMAGFAYFGLATSTMLSIVQIANIGLLHIPDFITNPLWWLTLGFASASALIIGRAHCAGACPFALVQEILYKLMRRRATSPQIAKRLDRRARYLKYYFLFLAIAAALLLGNASAANIEPFVTLFRGHGTKLAWSFLILMLIYSIFHFRFWCVYFCPVGALTGLTARLSLCKIKLKDHCSQCKNCASICPVQAIAYSADGAVVVDESECILCGRCIKGCPEGKLSLRSRHEKT